MIFLERICQITKNILSMIHKSCLNLFDDLLKKKMIVTCIWWLTSCVIVCLSCFFHHWRIFLSQGNIYFCLYIHKFCYWICTYIAGFLTYSICLYYFTFCHIKIIFLWILCSALCHSISRSGLSRTSVL